MFTSNKGQLLIWIKTESNLRGQLLLWVGPQGEPDHCHFLQGSQSIIAVHSQDVSTVTVRVTSNTTNLVPMTVTMLSYTAMLCCLCLRIADRNKALNIIFLTGMQAYMRLRPQRHGWRSRA